MNEQQLIEFLRNRLTLDLTTEEVGFAYDDGIRVQVRLLLDGEEIHAVSDSFKLPSRDQS